MTNNVANEEIKVENKVQVAEEIKEIKKEQKKKTMECLLELLEPDLKGLENVAKSTRMSTRNKINRRVKRIRLALDILKDEAGI